MNTLARWPGQLVVALLLLSMLSCFGCGATKQQKATEQLLASDAVDRSVGNIDFSLLSGRKVYLDTTYVSDIKDLGFVNAKYIISSLRQQMFAAGCRLQDKPEDAEYVVEARVGALGNDGHEVTYGIPASNILSTAASIVPNAPAIPTIPEVAFAKRNDQLGAAKIGVFAYERESRLPVWQSGTSTASSNASAVWLLGAGPFERGTIYDRPRFAGAQLGLPLLSLFRKKKSSEREGVLTATYDREIDFLSSRQEKEASEIRLSGFEEPLTEPAELPVDEQTDAAPAAPSPAP